MNKWQEICYCATFFGHIFNLNNLTFIKEINYLSFLNFIFFDLVKMSFLLNKIYQKMTKVFSLSSAFNIIIRLIKIFR
jgi:hypothetical protein